MISFVEAELRGTKLQSWTKNRSFFARNFFNL